MITPVKMKNFKIGDVVRVKAESWIDYDDRGHKVLFKDPIKNPYTATVTGQKRKYMGTYQGSGPHTFSGFDGNPPYLQVNGSILLWCVRKTMLGKEILVHDDDLEAVA